MSWGTRAEMVAYRRQGACSSRSEFAEYGDDEQRQTATLSGRPVKELQGLRVKTLRRC